MRYAEKRGGIAEETGSVSVYSLNVAETRTLACMLVVVRAAPTQAEEVVVVEVGAHHVVNATCEMKSRKCSSVRMKPPWSRPDRTGKQA